MSNENTERHFLPKKLPDINVASKEYFEERVEKVFKLLHETLSRSFGPYGAPTIIYNYPYSHVTKDGFTIMKNIVMDVSESLLDQSIANMASDICGRLNYTAGDGTTSAVIATNSIYENYLNMKNIVKDNYILPRDMIRKFNEIKAEVVERLKNESVQIQSEDLNVLAENIKKVVYISSNGDEVMTEYISSLYKELGCPAISCQLAQDGETKATIIDGYKYNIALTDKMYINNDNKTMTLGNTDVIIFSKRITIDTYNLILAPLAINCKNRGRHLIVAAPLYDDVALSQTIARELSREYKDNHDVNLVLMNYRATSANAKKLLSDFAMLLNTTMINSEIERDIIDQLKRGRHICEVFNIDNRGINGSTCVAYGDTKAVTYISGEDEERIDEMGLYRMNNTEDDIRLGFVSGCNLGLDTSIFTGPFVYNENLYEAHLRDAKEDLEEKSKKYQKLGTFNFEVSQAQDRLYSLMLKMGIIEIGADSELSQMMEKDAIDDAIKAAASSFTHGVVQGCNLTLIKILKDLRDNGLNNGKDESDDLTALLINILYNGYVDVYKTVLSNVFGDPTLGDALTDDVYKIVSNFKVFFNKVTKYKPVVYSDTFDDELLHDVVESCISESLKRNDKNDHVIKVHDVIINYSLRVDKVFDVSTFKYSNDIINSVETDENILKATIDLISLLMSGNQMVLTTRHNFE